MRARGHAPSLQEVSAKAVCRFASEHQSMEPLQATQKGEETESTPGVNGVDVDGPTRPKRRTGAGGAWRAFISSKASSKVPITSKSLSKEYRNLSKDELEYFEEVGRSMTLQGQYARYKAKTNMGDSDTATKSKSKSKSSTSNLALTCIESSEQILVSSTSVALVTGSSLADRLEVFRRIVNAEQAEKRVKKKHSESPADPTQEVKDIVVRDALARHGGQGFLGGLRQTPQDTDTVQHIVWKLPIIAFVQDRLIDLDFDYVTMTVTMTCMAVIMIVTIRGLDSGL